MTFEVCVDSLESALAAAQGGASRLELCSSLESGGLTPSPGLWRVVREQVSLPTMVLIRPRNGDFCYRSAELKVMCRDIEYFLAEGAKGTVFGALRPDARIDGSAMRSLVAVAQGGEMTFHRAFDVVANPWASLETVIELGLQRILTSGQAMTALDGIATLKEFVSQARGRIQIMPGGGIHEGNVRSILQGTGARELHFSGTAKDPTKSLSANSARTLSAVFGGEGRVRGSLGTRIGSKDSTETPRPPDIQVLFGGVSRDRQGTSAERVRAIIAAAQSHRVDDRPS